MHRFLHTADREGLAALRSAETFVPSGLRFSNPLFGDEGSNPSAEIHKKSSPKGAFFMDGGQRGCLTSTPIALKN